MMQKLLWTAVTLTIAISSHVDARPAPPVASQILAPLFQCLERAADADRHACLERETHLLRKLEGNKEIVVISHEQAEAMKGASNFKNDAHRLGKRNDTAAFAAVDSTIANASLTSGKWILTIANHGAWIQTDGEELGRTPKTGDRIRVRRGSFGGLLANINNGPAFRVRRIQ